MPELEQLKLLALAAIIALIPLVAMWLKLKFEIATTQLREQLADLKGSVATKETQDAIAGSINGHLWRPEQRTRAEDNPDDTGGPNHA